MKKRIQTLALAFVALTTTAGAEDLVNLRMSTRLDYQQEYVDGDKVNDNSGFKGKYLNVLLDGTIADGFSYSFKHRLNKMHSSSSFFDATDWVTLTYTYKNWSFSGGKQVVAVGGFEYDAAPIDIYFASEYWNNIACYQIGGSVAYTTDDSKHRFLFQLCESPFRKNEANINNKEMFAYNLMWYGNIAGKYDTMWSVNMMEYLPGKFINYITLGNQFRDGGLTINLDFMNRAVRAKDILFKDFSIMCKVNYAVSPKLNVFGKVTYDYNDTDTPGDWCVTPGTDIERLGGGVEFFPLKNSKDVRLHLNYCYSHGSNGSATGVLQDRQHIVDFGLTWRINIFKKSR